MMSPRDPHPSTGRILRQAQDALVDFLLRLTGFERCSIMYTQTG
jgi:hypothetical protein